MAFILHPKIRQDCIAALTFTSQEIKKSLRFLRMPSFFFNTMTKDEFNKLPLDDKYSVIFDYPGILKDRLIAYYRDSDWTISLWNCDSFFAEIHYSFQQKRVLKFEGITLNEARINLYLDYYLEHRKSEEYYLVEIA